MECVLLDKEGIARVLIDASNYATPMHRAERDRPEDEPIECAGKKLIVSGHRSS